MPHLLAEIVWFILPAGCANMAPVVAARLLPRLATPVDLGASIGGTRIFGDHKTIRGLVAGVLVGALVFVVQRQICGRSEWIRSVSVVDYGSIPVWFGAVMGFGALAGDLVKSFFKRRVGREPGRPWFPFDQLDWVIGTLAVTCPVARPGVVFVLATLALTLLLSLLVKWIGYLIHVDEKPI